MSINKNVRLYLPNDPYYYEVDNLPIQDLLNNDVDLETQIDELRVLIGNLPSGGSGQSIDMFAPSSKPGISGAEGKVFVNAGTFLARMSAPSTRKTGIDEMAVPGTNYPDPNDDLDETDGVGRFSPVRLLSATSIDIDPFDVNDFNSPGNTPLGRLDLVYLQGYPSLDVDEKTHTGQLEPKLGVIKGAGLVDPYGARWADGSVTKGEISPMAGSNVPTNGMGLNGETPSPEWGAVPADDIFNRFLPKLTDAETIASVVERNTTDANSTQNDFVFFGIPICYVWVEASETVTPNILTTDILDVRPFLRSAELTLHERQAVVFSVLPSASNPFTTQSQLDTVATAASNAASTADTQKARLDDTNSTAYENLVPTVMGTTTNAPGNHEGRLLSSETKMAKARFDIGVVSGGIDANTLAAATNSSDIDDLEDEHADVTGTNILGNTGLTGATGWGLGDIASFVKNFGFVRYNKHCILPKSLVEGADMDFEYGHALNDRGFSGGTWGTYPNWHNNSGDMTMFKSWMYRIPKTVASWETNTNEDKLQGHMLKYQLGGNLTSYDIHQQVLVGDMLVTVGYIGADGAASDLPGSTALPFGYNPLKAGTGTTWNGYEKDNSYVPFWIKLDDFGYADGDCVFNTLVMCNIQRFQGDLDHYTITGTFNRSNHRQELQCTQRYKGGTENIRSHGVGGSTHPAFHVNSHSQTVTSDFPAIEIVWNPPARADTNQKYRGMRAQIVIVGKADLESTWINDHFDHADHASNSGT